MFAAQISPDEAISNLGGWLENISDASAPGWLAAETADLWGMRIGVLLVLVAFFIWVARREKRKKHKNPAKETVPSQKPTEKKPSPNMKLKDVVSLIGGKNLEALKQIREKALYGNLSVWGKTHYPDSPLGESEPRKPISKGYWEIFQFDYLEFLKDPRGKTELAEPGGRGQVFYELWFDKNEVESEFPNKKVVHSKPLKQIPDISLNEAMFYSKYKNWDIHDISDEAFNTNRGGSALFLKEIWRRARNGELKIWGDLGNEKEKLIPAKYWKKYDLGLCFEKNLKDPTSIFVWPIKKWPKIEKYKNLRTCKSRVEEIWS